MNTKKKARFLRPRRHGGAERVYVWALFEKFNLHGQRERLSDHTSRKCRSRGAETVNDSAESRETRINAYDAK